MTGLAVVGLLLVGALCVLIAVAVRADKRGAEALLADFDAWRHPRDERGRFRPLTLAEVLAALGYELDACIDGIVEGVRRAKGS